MTENLPAVVERDLSTATLDELATIVRDEYHAAEHEHREAAACLSRSVQHAARSGRALSEARNRVPDGEWNSWITESAQIGTTAAKNLMRLAHYFAVIPQEVLEPSVDAVGRSHETGWMRALNSLKGLPRIRPSGIGGHPVEMKGRARALHNSGMAYEDIAFCLQVGRESVKCWCDPNYQRLKNKRRAGMDREKRAARRALSEKRQREERDALAKSTGGELGEAYSLIRRLLGNLHEALSDARSGEQRSAVEAAYSSATKAEDEIMRAMQAGRQDG